MSNISYEFVMTTEDVGGGANIFIEAEQDGPLPSTVYTFVTDTRGTVSVLWLFNGCRLMFIIVAVMKRRIRHDIGNC
jgi:hypothetical protein